LKDNPYLSTLERIEEELGCRKLDLSTKLVLRAFACSPKQARKYHPESNKVATPITLTIPITISSKILESE